MLTLIALLLVLMVIMVLEVLMNRILLGLEVVVVVLRLVPPAATSIHIRQTVIRLKLLMLLMLLMPDALVLHLEALGADLVAIHLRDGAFGGLGGVVRDETKSLRFARVPIDVNLGRYDVPKWSKGRNKIRIGHVMGQMVDEEVGSRRTLAGSRAGIGTTATFTTSAVLDSGIGFASSAV